MRKAVILFNLGGPDKLENVESFLFNLFYDPAILNLPFFLRYPLAKLIAKKRAPTAKKIYEELGGSSPILRLTKEQANALEIKLNKDDNKYEYKCFIVMRCWHPRAENVVKEVINFKPNEITLMPLYPQFSAATSGSSIKEWNDICLKNNFKIKTSTICCYPTDVNFIEAHKQEIKKKIKGLENFKLIFSAHGLPEKNIKKGDPYQWQVEQSVDRIVKLGKHIVLVPVAFVSEHSETLVELDIEYRELAEKNGCKNYSRVPALGTNENYIKAMSDLIINIQDYNFNGDLFPPKIQCPNQFKKCPCLNYE